MSLTVNLSDPQGFSASMTEATEQNGSPGFSASMSGVLALAGPPGPPGDDGKSAYEIAVENGFEGTEAEWLESLKVGTVQSVNGVSPDENGNVELPVYDGTFTITPSASNDLTLLTAQTYMDSDIKVEKIPYAEVTNNSGGTTATIGGN